VRDGRFECEREKREKESVGQLTCCVVPQAVLKAGSLCTEAEACILPPLHANRTEGSMWNRHACCRHPAALHLTHSITHSQLTHSSPTRISPACQADAERSLERLHEAAETQLKKVMESHKASGGNLDIETFRVSQSEGLYCFSTHDGSESPAHPVLDLVPQTFFTPPTQPVHNS
jgi:hypothetical protein